MLRFENSTAIKAVSSLKHLTSAYLLGELDRQAFELERRELLSDLCRPVTRRRACRPLGLTLRHAGLADETRDPDEIGMLDERVGFDEFDDLDDADDIDGAWFTD